MAVTSAGGIASGAGKRVQWDATYDTVTRVVILDATCVFMEDGSPAPAPSVAEAVIGLSNGQSRTFDLVPILNQGAQTFTNVNLRVSSDRAQGWTFSTNYTP